MLDTAKLKALREKRGLTQEQAALAAGLSETERSARQRWNAIESGRRPSINLTTLDKIARALGVKARDLLK